MTPEQQTDNELTSAEYWQYEFWQIGDKEIPDLTFDPEHPEYREIYAFCKKHLPAPNSETRLLELGCHPGR